MSASNSTTVYLDGDWNEEHVDRLRALLADGVRVVTGSIPDDCRIIVSGRPTRNMLEASPSLTHLLIPWAGLPDSTRETMREYPHISVHNIHHNASSAAELAVGLMIAAARLIVPADRELRKGDWSWRYRQSEAVIVEGSRVLLLGYGHIGRRVGSITAAMGAAVSAVSRSPERHGNASGAEVHPPEDLHGLLPVTDFLVISLPLTELTRGIIGEEELSLMHDRSILVNVGRGALVEQEPLFRSLRDGGIGAAGIDVWYRYPSSSGERASTMPSDMDFSSLDNVVMTPHMGGAFGSSSLELSRCVHLADSINSFHSSGRMPGKVDLEAGY